MAEDSEKTAEDRLTAMLATSCCPSLVLAFAGIFFVQTFDFPGGGGDVGPAGVPICGSGFTTLFTVALIIQAVMKKMAPDPIPGQIGFVLLFAGWLVVYLIGIRMPATTSARSSFLSCRCTCWATADMVIDLHRGDRVAGVFLLRVFQVPVHSAARGLADAAAGRIERCEETNVQQPEKGGTMAKKGLPSKEIRKSSRGSSRIYQQLLRPDRQSEPDEDEDATVSRKSSEKGARDLLIAKRIITERKEQSGPGGAETPADGGKSNQRTRRRRTWQPARDAAGRDRARPALNWIGQDNGATNGSCCLPGPNGWSANSTSSWTGSSRPACCSSAPSRATCATAITPEFTEAVDEVHRLERPTTTQSRRSRPVSTSRPSFPICGPTCCGLIEGLDGILSVYQANCFRLAIEQPDIPEEFQPRFQGAGQDRHRLCGFAHHGLAGLLHQSRSGARPRCEGRCSTRPRPTRSRPG